MVNEERKCSGSQFNVSISVGSSLFDAVNREDVEKLPGAVVVQCLGAGQLPELEQVQEMGSNTSGGLPLTGKYLFMAIKSGMKIPHEQTL